MKSSVARQIRIEKVRSLLSKTDVDAARHVAAMVVGATPNAGETKLSNQDKAALAMVGGFRAQERAQQMSEAPKSFQLVVMPQRLPDTPDGHAAWRERVAALRDQRAIEAVPAPKETP